MKRRLRWALALSVLLHAIALVVWRRAPAPERTPLVESRQPLQFEVVEVTPPPPPPLPPSPVARPKKAAPEPVATVEAPPPLEPLIAQPRTQSAPPPADRPGADAPRTAAAPRTESSAPPPLALLPRGDAIALPAPEEPRGRTIHNTPEELPDPAAVAAYDAERVKQRVDGWANQVLARGRVENGVVSPYFHDLRHRLESATAKPPPFVEPFGLSTLPQHGQQAYRAWSDGAQRYGKTGSGYAAPTGHQADDVPSSVQAEVERGSTEARAFSQRLQAGARLRDFGDGRMGEELIAIVEVKQGADGSLADLALIQPSSSVRFDAWVMEQAPKAIDGLAAPPDAGVGIHPTGLRSIWAFKGRITYKRDFKDTTLTDDGWYLALMAIPGALTGNFDEVSGKVEYVDLRHPRYECRVQLLEVY